MQRPKPTSRASRLRTARSRTCRSWVAVPILLTFLIIHAGCGLFAYSARVTGQGDARALEAVLDRQSEVTDADAALVRVFEGRLPEGDFRRVTEVGTEVPGGLYPGTFIPGYIYYSLSERNYRVFYPFRKTWRRALCWPQMPLQFLTLNLWSLLPFYWPCGAIGHGPNTNEGVKERQGLQIAALRRMAVALGGDTVLIEGWHDRYVRSDVDGRDKLVAKSAGVRAIVYKEQGRIAGYEERFPILFSSVAVAKQPEDAPGKKGDPTRPGPAPGIPPGADTLLVVQTAPEVQASFARLVENLLFERLKQAGPFGMLPPADDGAVATPCADQACAVSRGRDNRARVVLWVTVHAWQGPGFHLVALALDTKTGQLFRKVEGRARDFRQLAVTVEGLARGLSTTDDR